MKHFIIMVCLLFSGHLYAQQAKAYELVQYVAKYDGHTYLLAYADGYPAASRIKIKQSDRITFIFQPVNNAVDNNGDLIFMSAKGKQAGQISLHKIDQNKIAPAIFRATYFLKGRKISLKFNNIKK